MVRITEQLVRKRAEHNELEISTLEELSLHQQDIEKIEYLDKWCRDLRILYLQSNLIEKIENVSRLKKLEYLNLALNNVERIENLEGCESLNKLDLTVNFVGELTSICTLQSLEFLRELYLTGNPCTEYEGYRDYVIATLPQLAKLDGTDIEKSERIAAVQKYSTVRDFIITQQNMYMVKREKERVEEQLKLEQKERPGFDGRWYTDINQSDAAGDKIDKGADNELDEAEKWEQEKKSFWEETTAYTPESRKQMHEHMKKAREKDEKKDKEPEKKRERQLFNEADGRPLNINEAKVDFTFTDDEKKCQYVLDIAAFKHMDTSLMDADVHPFYVRVVFKGKIFQLCLDEEVNADKSKAQRSTTTGHLVITMPKANSTITSAELNHSKVDKTCKEKKASTDSKILEVDPSKHSMPDIVNIVKDKEYLPPLGTVKKRQTKERENSPDFIDDPDVPPLI